jgi:LacI family transcriptional regulator
MKDITIYDIASQLNISVATVSRALNDDPVVHRETRRRILDFAEEMGYRPNHFASNLRKGRTNTIGFLVHELQSNFINSVLAGVEKVTTDAGYDVIIALSLESYQREAANATNLFQKRVDGLITSLSLETKSLDHFRPFIKKGIPVVFFDRVEKSTDNTVVIIDNRKAGYQATQHLIDQGCKKIVHVTSNLARNVYSERYRGYRDALAGNGIAFDENFLLVDDLSEEAGIASARQMMRMRPRPDGAFITNDFVAASCMRTLKQNGFVIPKDIAIVGFNNDAIGQLIEPALTTIRYPGREMGELAAAHVIRCIDCVSNIPRVQEIVLCTELIIRQSSIRKR